MYFFFCAPSRGAKKKLKHKMSRQLSPEVDASAENFHSDSENFEAVSDAPAREAVDDYDNVSVDDDDDDEAESEPEGEDIGDDDTEDEEEEEPLNDDDDNENDDAGDGDGDGDGDGADDDDDDDGKKKQERAPPKRRPVDGDEILMCFYPVGQVFGDPKAILGVTYAGVRTLREEILAETLQALFNGAEPEEPEAHKTFFENYDFYEHQTDPDMPLIRHLCQLTSSERMLRRKTPAEQRAFLERALTSQRSMMSKPRRTLVYCTLRFDSVEEAREHSCPLLCYPIKGRLSVTHPATLNWQSATEWSHTNYDVYNARPNAALMPESVLRRSNAAETVNMYCSVRRPISENSLFEVAYVKRTKFPETDNEKPVRHNFKLSHAGRVSSLDSFFSGVNTVTRAQIRLALSRTNFFLYASEKNTLDLARPPGYVDSRCKELFTSSPSVAAVMCSRHDHAKRIRTSLFKEPMRAAIVPGSMGFADCVRCLVGMNLSGDSMWANTKFDALVRMVLPATAPATFWHAVEFFGFDAALKSVLLDYTEKLLAEMEKEAAHNIMTDSKFAMFSFAGNKRLVRALAKHFNVSVEEMTCYAALRAEVRTLLADTDRRVLSRPEISAAIRSLCWPTLKTASLAAFEVDTECGRKTTLYTTSAMMALEAVIAVSLVQCFDKNVSLLRSASVDELRSQVWLQMFDNDEKYLVLVNSRDDEQYWRWKCAKSANVAVIVESDIARVPRVEDGLFALVVPRVDAFTYKSLAEALILLCTSCTLETARTNSWARSCFAPRDSDGWRSTNTDFKTGPCGRRVIIGGLAFQNAAPFLNNGCIIDDLYFSGVFSAPASAIERVKAHYENVEELRERACVRIKFSSDHAINSAAAIAGETRSLMNSTRVSTRVLIDTLHVTGDWHGLMLAQLVNERQTTFRDELLPIEKNGCVVIVYDCVDDNCFFKRRREFEKLKFGYQFDVRGAPDAALTNRVIVDYMEARRVRADGLTPRNLIMLLASKPAAMLVLGSRRQSIEERLVQQQHAPWFFRPPAKNNLDRPWYDNVEQSNISALCWMLPMIWKK